MFLNDLYCKCDENEVAAQFEGYDNFKVYMLRPMFQKIHYKFI